MPVSHFDQEIQLQEVQLGGDLASALAHPAALDHLRV
jgi:hypothetical protein